MTAEERLRLTDHEIQEAYRQVYALTDLCGVIAGGAAADFRRAGDIDVFFAEIDTWRWVCQNLGVDPKEAGGAGDYPEVLGGEQFPLVVASPGVQVCGLPVQLIWWNHPSMTTPLMINSTPAQEWLSEFDISTHQVAQLYNVTDTIPAYGRFRTVPSFPPRIVHPRNHDYPRTLNRYLKICARYGHTPEEGELAKVEVPRACLPVLLKGVREGYQGSERIVLL